VAGTDTTNGLGSATMSTDKARSPRLLQNATTTAKPKSPEYKDPYPMPKPGKQVVSVAYRKELITITIFVLAFVFLRQAGSE
ncbi:unnamed protein product, partial [Polarella glacialis]